MGSRNDLCRPWRRRVSAAICVVRGLLPAATRAEAAGGARKKYQKKRKILFHFGFVPSILVVGVALGADDLVDDVAWKAIKKTLTAMARDSIFNRLRQ